MPDPLTQQSRDPFDWDKSITPSRDPDSNMRAWGNQGQPAAIAAAPQLDSGYGNFRTDQLARLNSPSGVQGAGATNQSQWNTWENTNIDPSISSGTGDSGFWSMDGFLGDQNNMGWGGAALGAAQLGMNAWLGYQNLNVAKDTLATNKRQFSDQFNAQAGLTNAELRSRQIRRNRENPDSIPVDEYMQTAGIEEV